jgi:hypothetical protein
MLMSRLGGTALLGTSAEAARRAAIALATIAMEADEECGLAGAALQWEQDNCMARRWHGSAAQALDNGKLFLSQ